MTQVYIGHLSQDTTSADLEAAFSQNGLHPSKITIIQDRDTGASRGIGYATFENSNQAQHAINALSHTQIHGSEVELSFSNFRPQGQRGTGGYGQAAEATGGGYQGSGGYQGYY
ncbi:hypothetical protein BDV12DRAFT_179204 [Aspergillus spectabilis]